MNAPQTPKTPPEKETGSRTIPWGARLALLLFMGVAAVTVWVTNQQLTHRFTDSTRNRGELRLALYSGNLVSELRRHAIVPQLLARDQTLIAALQSQDFSLSTQRLLSFIDEIGANSIMLMASDGRTVAATNRNRLGENHRNEAYFVDAARARSTVFSVIKREVGGYRFTYS
ncbi:MAG: sensor histidine kinase, partial [Pseudophaeobacter sp.]